MEPKAAEEEFRHQVGGIYGHPEQDPFLAIAKPGEDAEQGDKRVERSQRETELLAAQPFKFQISFGGCDGFGAADARRDSNPPAVPSSVENSGAFHTRTASTPLRAWPRP